MPTFSQVKLRRIFFSKNNWTACLLENVDPERQNGEDKVFRAAGSVTFSPCIIGGVYAIQGEWIVDPKYGRQVTMSSVDVDSIPITIETLADFLKERVPAKQAREMLAVHGLKLLDKLKTNSISDFPCDKIYGEWLTFIENTEICKELSGLGIAATYHADIISAWGRRCVEEIRANPYILMFISGIGFRRADLVGTNLGISPVDPRRMNAAVEYAAGEEAANGHTYTPMNLLSREASKLAGFEMDVGKMVVPNSEQENGNFFLRYLYHAERDSAETLYNYFSLAPIWDDINHPDPKREQIRKDILFEATLNPLQSEAYLAAQLSRILVITGGPGTGKTHVLKAIISALQATHFTMGEMVLLAPTGKAAVRMHDLTRYPAQTIHSLLQPVDDSLTRFGRNSANPLDPGTYIIDECSMVNIRLFHSFLSALPQSGVRLILVGDADQLPAIGPGNVLADIISAGNVPVVKLTEVVRTQAASKIVTNAQKILHGSTALEEGGDFEIVRLEDPVRIMERIKLILLDESPTAQVISPMNKGDLGTTILNPYIQGILNPQGEQIRGTRFRVHDRVVALVNNSETGIMNGDMGVIEGYSDDLEKGGILISWDSHSTRLHPKEFTENMILAYAVTIHKAQGGEFDHVVVVLHRSHFIMLRRNLIYTAVTRAKQKVTIIGAPALIAKAIKTLGEQRRTKLAEMLRVPF